MQSFRELFENNAVEVDTYHGSGKLFKQFNQSHGRIPNDNMGGGVGYFTNNHDVAKTYAKSMARYHKTDTPYVYHTKLKMKNVFDVDHDFTGPKLTHVLPKNEAEHEDFARGAGLIKAGGEDKHTVLAKLRSGGMTLKGHQVFKGLSKGNVNTAKARDHLVSNGYDGIRYNGPGENHHVYIPYDSGSIHINKITKIVKK